MARQRYIQDPVTHELVPAEDYAGPSKSEASYIAPDIQPYRSTITGELISSRSHHREHLKAHGCFEIGNETKAFMETSRPKQTHDRE
ncbi:hypothetical protein Q0L85_13830, partial [Staphylococcus aureus]|nr:hypothetical protein [Staphylococcus aureus]